MEESSQAEVDPTPETETAAIMPADPSSAEDASPPIDEAPVLATIEIPDAEDIAPLRELVKGLGEQLTRRLDAVQSLLEREQRADASRERVVDRLHAELQEYKQDLLLKVQRPIFIDLIQLHDDIGKMMEARAPEGSEPERTASLRGILESIQTAIEDILYRQGVEPFAVEGDTFDPRRQRAVSTVATDDPGRNKTIAVRLRKGFQSGDKPIRPEIVSVYTFRA
jgi:molecular chaperone GrpE